MSLISSFVILLNFVAVRPPLGKTISGNYTEQYVSFNRRANEIDGLIEQDRAALVKLAWCLRQASNPRRCTEILGLRRHPSVVADSAMRDMTWTASVDAHRSRGRVHGKVIYHADPRSLYSDPVPDLEFWAFDGGGDVSARASVGHAADRPSASDHAGPRESSGDGPSDIDLRNQVHMGVVAPDLLDPEVELAPSPLDVSSSLDAPSSLSLALSVGAGLGTDVSLQSVLGLGAMLAPALRRHFCSKWGLSVGGDSEGGRSGYIFSVPMAEGSFPRVSSMSAMLKSSICEAISVQPQELPLSMQADGAAMMYFSILRMRPGRI